MTRKSVKEVVLTEPIVLGDLRWLVEQCVGFSDDSMVTIKGRVEYDARDYDPGKITVRADK